MRRVVMLACNGIDLLEFAIALEIFASVRRETDNLCRLDLAAAEEGAPGLGFPGFATHARLDLLSGADTVLIPGWRDPRERPSEAILAAVEAAHASGARIISLGTGAFVAAAAGILAGRLATTHWRFCDILARDYPQVRLVRDALYLDDGDVVTSAGSAATLDLVLHLVRKAHGDEVANGVARDLVVGPHRAGEQPQYVARPVPRAFEASRLGPLFERMCRRLAEPQSVAGLASEVGMSRRTFLRRFEEATGTSPARWLLRERLVRARMMLETGDLPLEDIAEACGFGSANNLRNCFRSHVGPTPSDYRRWARQSGRDR